MTNHVGIVIVSHSAEISKGTADMVYQMVGDSVPLSWCGGNSDGGLGSNYLEIKSAIEKVWNPAGVAVLIDLGGTEANCEMAIEALPEDQRKLIAICDAPIVEGAVMAATEASCGSPLTKVVETAEELSPKN